MLFGLSRQKKQSNRVQLDVIFRWNTSHYNFCNFDLDLALEQLNRIHSVANYRNAKNISLELFGFEITSTARHYYLDKALLNRLKDINTIYKLINRIVNIVNFNEIELATFVVNYFLFLFSKGVSVDELCSADLEKYYPFIHMLNKHENDQIMTSYKGVELEYHPFGNFLIATKKGTFKDVAPLEEKRGRTINWQLTHRPKIY